MYKPLPDSLKIDNSGIAGQGLIATKDIEKGTQLGIGWHMIDHNNIRTPLGGFINHSDTPNCEKYLVGGDNNGVCYLMTLKDIKAGEELTMTYTLYDPSK